MINYQRTKRHWNKALEKLKASQCAYCQRKNLPNPYFYLKGTEYEKAFCNQTCLSAYLAPCDECGNNRCGTNWQRTNQDDGGKNSVQKNALIGIIIYHQTKHKIAEKVIKAMLLIHNTMRERERERESNIYHLNTVLNASN